VNPVRPTSFPAAQPLAATPATEGARLAAQRAFFKVAQNPAVSAAAPAQVTAPSASTPAASAAQPAQKIPDPNAEPPQRILRPGSLLDIRV
jgi:hypothetical protein